MDNQDNTNTNYSNHNNYGNDYNNNDKSDNNKNNNNKDDKELKHEKLLDKEYQKKIVERKKRFLEELKTEDSVFDSRTLLTLHSLLNGKHIDELLGVINSGKESVVFSAVKENKYFAVKVYRVSTCDFKTMWKYIQGDPRFHLRKSSTRQIIHAWVEKEYRNLKRANYYVNSPKALLRRENVLLMELIHDNNGAPSPRLKDVNVDYAKFYEIIKEDLKTLYNDAQLVHGDLSEYNILVKDDKPVYIDFSQGVIVQHPLSKSLLIRDIKNITNFFKRKGIECDYKELYRYITGEELRPIDEELANNY
ncbi:serine protein kinase RIO [Methanothermococcus okinawensis]|uniref:non-specific serine/threonine protein kinase n=1 Tax=Methanothermococcus okinawensis (strain DSM 14208 / JCM 11175 / IH1) TaxID=647113 RepID=F8ANX6_METOI|nr:serine protein kinase RIO [Methanothermococcus okinawensis]AEH07117.1 Non-specific serine/threonine protein kinase [Methanothermococcus okinawensis IH1]